MSILSTIKKNFILIISRLDSDDCYNINYVNNIQEIVIKNSEKREDLLINYNNGIYHNKLLLSNIPDIC